MARHVGQPLPGGHMGARLRQDPDEGQHGHGNHQLGRPKGRPVECLYRVLPSVPCTDRFADHGAPGRPTPCVP
eukprot:15002447-Alexandrium_andersonii.AAC.1